MAKLTAIEQFEHHAARAFFASAWVDQCDDAEQSMLISGKEIMHCMPEELDPSAISAARTLRMDIERANAAGIESIMLKIEGMADGDREATMEYFGHYAAMQAMGHGVGLYDAFGSDVYDAIKIPYTEFGGYSLEGDYF